MRYLAFVAVVLAVSSWSFAVGRYEAFPFDQIVWVKRSLIPPPATPEPSLKVSKAWEMDVSLFRSLDSTPEVVMLGDSITAGGEWQELLPGVSVANRGIGGDTSEGVLARLDEIEARNPRIVFLLIGINDLDRGSSPDAIVARHEEIADRLSDEDTRLVIQSVIVPAENPWNDSIRSSVESLNSGLRSLAESRGIEFVDLNKHLAPAGSLATKYTGDGVHLNGDGYAVWAGVIRGVLMEK